jgi:hypothetical protein
MSRRARLSGREILLTGPAPISPTSVRCWSCRCGVNAEEKIHRRVGVKMHHGAASQGHVERYVSI